jgi:rubrerythrin
MAKIESIPAIDQYMLQNAIDFLSRSVTSYHGEDYKMALIFLWSGLLLIMKVRLFRIQPVLIYSNDRDVFKIDPKTKMPRYCTFDAQGNKRTVDYQQIKERLRMLGIQTDLFKYDNQLRQIQNHRNRVEHFIDDITQDEYASDINAVLPLLSSLIENELGEKIEKLFKNWEDFLAIDSFYKERIRKMKQQIEVREYLSATDGDIIYTHKCPECPDGEMINDEYNLRCPACGYKSDYYVCSRCNGAFFPDEWSKLSKDIGICDDCFNSIVDNSD